MRPTCPQAKPFRWRTGETLRTVVAVVAVLDALAGLLDAGLDLVLPRPCPGCFGPDPWCARCDATLAGQPRLVRLSAEVLDAADRPIPVVRAMSRYRGPPRAAVLAAKEHGRRDLPARLAFQMSRAVIFASLMDGQTPEWLVPAPSRRASVRARGFDPVAALARSTAGLLAEQGRPVGVAHCLQTAGRARDSVGLTAAARLQNLSGRVRFVASGGPPPGSPVLLIDDVVTSGATALAATDVLTNHGFQVLSVLAVASAAPFA